MLSGGPSVRQLRQKGGGRITLGRNPRFPDRLSMKDAPYTPNSMDAARGATESRDPRFDELYAEAKSTLRYGANNLRSVTERYREDYYDSLGRWHNLRDQGEAVDRSPVIPTDKTDPAAAAEAGAEDAGQKALRAEVER